MSLFVYEASQNCVRYLCGLQFKMFIFVTVRIEHA